MEPALVIIHGYGGSPAEMVPLRRLLGETLRVVMPTMPAHGGRPLPESPGFETYLDDLWGQIEAEVPGPAVLFGYSLGGYFALTLAHRQPERVAGVATLGTQHRIDDSALAYMRGLLTPERLFGPNGERREAVEKRIGGAYTPDRFARAVAMYERLHDDPPLTDADLRAIAVPALIISGEQDPLAPGRSTRELAGLLPNARLAMLPGLAHPIDRVPIDLVAREMRRFLKDLSGEFVAGPPVDLGPTLVAGGLPKQDAAITVRVRRD